MIVNCFQLEEQLGTGANEEGSLYWKVEVTGVAKVTGLGLGVASWTLNNNNSALNGIVSEITWLQRSQTSSKVRV